MRIARCTLDLPATGEVPEWVHIMPAGRFQALDGRGPYRVADALAVIAASTAEPIPVDENHSTMLATKAGGPSPARGWIARMEVRANGIWGQVAWNAAGRALMTDRAYRALSPVYAHTTSGDVLQILSVALTNNPALPQLTSLFTNQETGMDPVQFRAALGLPDTADEAAILARVTTLAQGASAHAAIMSRIATAAGVQASDPEAIITALATRQDGAAQITQMTSTITGLETRIAGMQADQARRDAVTFVDQAIRDGKPINALRDHYIARFTADPDAVRTEIAALPSIHDGGMKPRPPVDPKDVDLTAEDKQVIAQMNLDPDLYRKTKAARLGGLPSGEAD